MIGYAGKYLKTIMSTRFLPEGIIVYCIHDNLENLFVIKTFQVYNHVQEFHFDQSDKKKFKIYNQGI